LKLFTLLILFFSTNAMAQMEFDVEKITFTTFVSVLELNCVIPLGRRMPVKDRIFTELSGHLFKKGPNSKFEFDHRDATSKGCESELLDQLIENAMQQHFGHVEAEITLVKSTALKPRIVFGICQRNYQEEVVIDLGNLIILKTPLLGKLIPAEGC